MNHDDLTPSPPAPLTDQDLAAIAERTAQATAGPWRWLEDTFRHKYQQQLRNGTWRAKPGHRSTDSWVFLLAGPQLRSEFPLRMTEEEAIERRILDEWDYHHVLALRWSELRRTSFSGGPGSPDAAFIAHAREDIPRLLAEVRRLREELAARPEGPCPDI